MGYGLVEGLDGTGDSATNITLLVPVPIALGKLLPIKFSMPDW